MNEGVRAPGRTHTLSRQPEAPVFVAEVPGWLIGVANAYSSQATVIVVHEVTSRLRDRYSCRCGGSHPHDHGGASLALLHSQRCYAVLRDTGGNEIGVCALSRVAREQQLPSIHAPNIVRRDEVPT